MESISSEDALERLVTCIKCMCDDGEDLARLYQEYVLSEEQSAEYDSKRGEIIIRP